MVNIAKLPPSRQHEVYRILSELAKRSTESLRLYEPLPIQEKFLESQAPERVLRGSNQSGKTLTAAVAVSRIVLGQDPYFPNPGIAFCVAKDMGRIGDVVWRALGRSGAFLTIKDMATGNLRAYRPWDPRDACRKQEAIQSEPLIPERMVQSISWESKKSNSPKIVHLTTGWEMHFFSSLGKPPQGSKISLCWFDEEIVDPDWHPELSARLMAKAGKFIWSATPQAGTEQLYRLHEQAEEQRLEKAPRVEEFVLFLDNNVHISQAQKDLFVSKIMTDEQYRVRVLGEFAILSFRVFPTAQRGSFDVEPFNIPSNWTRYMVVDPGYQVCCVLFFAVPPPEKGDYLYLYDELYIKNCSATVFGKTVSDRVGGDTFHAFVIDHHGGRMSDIGSGRTIEDQYSEALRDHRVSCEISGCQFTWGSPDVKAGVEACREVIRIRPDGTVKLKVLAGAAPNFEDEIIHYRFKRENGVVVDTPVASGNVHAMACLRYIAMYRPRYHKPKIKRKRAATALEAFKAKRKKKNPEGKSINLGPPERSER